MTWRTVVWRRQTSHPPRHRPPLECNPLMRWSRRLIPWRRATVLLPSVTVGLEGCESAFNALNAVRTTQFFGTGQPPVFMSLGSWREMANLQTRHTGSDAETVATNVLDDVALFGRHTFLHALNTSSPLVALENFTPRAESVLHRRVPSQARLVVGHENHGVGAALLRGGGDATDSAPGEARSVAPAEDMCAAEVVLYIPQYGTISSLNVVTALGIALFYAFLDQNCPRARTPRCEASQTACLPNRAAESTSSAAVSADISDAGVTVDASAEAVAHLHRILQRYQSAFYTELPHRDANHPCDEAMTTTEQLPNRPSSGRMDARPVHPAYYNKDEEKIRSDHQAFRRRLLDFSNAERRTRGRPARDRFGLSVLYENVHDRRNFGGLMRSANAFLVDAVCYVGRRKCNVVGAIGCHHYTPPHHISCDLLDGYSNDAGDDALSVTDIAKANDTLRAQVERACGGPCRWWLLDCGHAALYTVASSPTVADRKSGEPTSRMDDTAMGARYSSAASLAWYTAQWAHAEERVISLCDDEATLCRAAEDGVLLLVPQEGRLPHISLLSQCERIITVLPRTQHQQQQGQTAGLPSQVASGIALQRISTVLHPCLCLL